MDEAAKLHDVGKIKVDVKILQKPARLTDEEFAEIKQHTVYGFAMISPKDEMIASLILSHHERWDGSGYPNGLSGCNIPYLSRVIAVADSIDAMMSDRCYRKALSWSQCLDELDKTEQNVRPESRGCGICMSGYDIQCSSCRLEAGESLLFFQVRFVILYISKNKEVKSYVQSRYF